MKTEWPSLPTEFSSSALISKNIKPELCPRECHQKSPSCSIRFKPLLLSQRRQLQSENSSTNNLHAGSKLPCSIYQWKWPFDISPVKDCSYAQEIQSGDHRKWSFTHDKWQIIEGGKDMRTTCNIMKTLPWTYVAVLEKVWVIYSWLIIHDSGIWQSSHHIHSNDYHDLRPVWVLSDLYWELLPV